MDHHSLNDTFTTSPSFSSTPSTSSSATAASFQAPLTQSQQQQQKINLPQASFSRLPHPSSGNSHPQPSTNYVMDSSKSSLHVQNHQQLHQQQQKTNVHELRESSSRCRANSSSTVATASLPACEVTSAPGSASSSAPTSFLTNLSTLPPLRNEPTSATSHETLTQLNPGHIQTAVHELSARPIGQEHQLQAQHQQPVPQQQYTGNPFYQIQPIGQPFPSGNQQQVIGHQQQLNRHVTWNEDVVHAGNPFEYQEGSNLYQQQPYNYYSDPSSQYSSLHPVM